MSILFNEHLEQGWQTFGITRSLITDAINTPDSTFAFEPSPDGALIEVICGPLEVASQCSPLIILKRQGDDREVWMAFWIPEGLVNLAESKEPRALLRLLTQKFGLPFRLLTDATSYVEDKVYPFPTTEDDVQILRGLPEKTSFMVLPLFRTIGQGEERQLHVLLAFCLDVDRYKEWLGLGPSKDASSPTIIIADQLKGQMTPRALISYAGAFMIEVTSLERGATTTLFALQYEGYMLEAGIKDGKLFIRRNDTFVEISVPSDGPVLLFMRWLPRALELETRVKKGTKVQRPVNFKRLETSLAAPPVGLIGWARRQSIAPITVYPTEGDFFSTVADALDATEEKITTTSMFPAFWDYQREGRKVVSKKPKRETDIHPTVDALLRDIALAKNFDVDREVIVAGGALDFQFVGSCASGERSRVCVEFKHAHSGDVVHGVSVQLPEYMRAKACSFGIYVVLYFRGDDFDKPSRDLNELRLELEKHRVQTGLNIRIVLWNLSRPVPPSKR